MRTALANRPARSRAWVVQQLFGVLLDEELHQGRREDVLDQPRVIAAGDSSLDLGPGHVELEVDWLVAHDAPSPERSGTTLPASGLTMRSTMAASFSKASAFSSR